MTTIQRCLGLALPGLITLVSPSQAQIESATRLTANPIQYGRVDFVVMLTATWTDPFRASEVRLDFEVTSPSGKSIVVPGYFERGASGATSAWRIRFAPREAGTYRGHFILTDHGTSFSSIAIDFNAAASAGKGFLQLHDPWTFRFDDGTPFRGIGQNLCWESRSFDDSRHFKALHENQRYNYEYLLGTLSASGGNFFRTWMCAWNLPLEWKKVKDTARYSDDSGHFNASAIQRMDQLVELATQTNTYFMLALDPHGSFLDAGWADNNYNRRNGGPATTPLEFFSSSAAKIQYKDRLRYLVARWGYSPHLAIWEFFNEIDNAMYGQKPDRIPDDIVTAWHTEMSAFLKSIDPYDRVVTTSISHREVAGLSGIPSIDLNQRHIYKNTDAIAETIRLGLRTNGKPTVIGEFAYEWDWTKDFTHFADRMDHDFKHGLWLGLFSPTPILPMSWWWEFFDERKLPHYFARVRALHDQMLFAGGGGYEAVAAQWTGDPLRHLLAVRCGETTFILLSNTSQASATGQLSLSETVRNNSAIRSYDTETDEYRDVPASETSMTIPAHRDIVLIVTAGR